MGLLLSRSHLHGQNNGLQRPSFGLKIMGEEDPPPRAPPLDPPLHPTMLRPFAQGFTDSLKGINRLSRGGPE